MISICFNSKKVDCTWNEWTSWSTCSETCGNGTWSRTRDELQSAQNGGAPCNGSNEENQACNLGTCASEYRVGFLNYIDSIFNSINIFSFL